MCRYITRCLFLLLSDCNQTLSKESGGVFQPVAVGVHSVLLRCIDIVVSHRFLPSRHKVCIRPTVSWSSLLNNNLTFLPGSVTFTSGHRVNMPLQDITHSLWPRDFAVGNARLCPHRLSSLTVNLFCRTVCFPLNFPLYQVHWTTDIQHRGPFEDSLYSYHWIPFL